MSTQHNFLLPLPAVNDQPELAALAAPTTIQVMPASGAQGIDGRVVSYEANTLVQAFNLGRRDLPIDIEHASEIKASKGEPAPAVGWIKALFIDAEQAGLWAQVEWTEQGRQLISSRAYRYLSPAFDTRKGTAVRLSSVALTNKPNLPLPALNREQAQEQQPEQDPSNSTTDKEISKMKNIAMKLGLNPEASEEAILSELQKRDEAANKALHRAQNPDAKEFVPIADYQQVEARAKKAEDALQAINDKELHSIIDGAIQTGKIAPSSKDFYLNAGKVAGGKEQLQQMFAQSEALVPTDASTQLHRQNSKAAAQSPALSAEQQSIYSNLGIAPDAQ